MVQLLIGLAVDLAVKKSSTRHTLTYLSTFEVCCRTAFRKFNRPLNFLSEKNVPVAAQPLPRVKRFLPSEDASRSHLRRRNRTVDAGDSPTG